MKDRTIELRKAKQPSKVFADLIFSQEVKGHYKQVNTVALTRSEAQTLFLLLHEALR